MLLQDQQADIREWVAHHAAVGAGEHIQIQMLQFNQKFKFSTKHLSLGPSCRRCWLRMLLMCGKPWQAQLICSCLLQCLGFGLDTMTNTQTLLIAPMRSELTGRLYIYDTGSRPPLNETLQVRMATSAPGA